MQSELYLVTGANGFTGLAVASYLRSIGKPVRALVRSQHDTDKLRAIGAEVVFGDLTKPETLAPALEGVTGVLHVAALFRKAGGPKSDFFDINAQGTRNLCEEAIKAGVKRFVHCSTVGVVRSVENPPGDESLPYNPGDVYQESKVEGEKIALEYMRSGKLPGVVIRPAMIYGPGDTRFLKLFSMIAKGTFFYIGHGKGLVHFIDVRDLARSFWLGMEHSEVNGEVFIIAGKRTLPLDSFVSLVARDLGVPSRFPKIPYLIMYPLALACELVCKPLGIEPPLFRRRIDFFIKHRSFSTEKAKQLLGFEPAQDLEQEIADMVDSCEALGSLKRTGKARVANIERALSGSIQAWDTEAEALYGWQSEQAVGKTMHELLSTAFPYSLAQIHSELKEKGFWCGSVTQKRKDGSRIRVRSSWFTDPLKPGVVIERNDLECAGGGGIFTRIFRGKRAIPLFRRWSRPRWPRPLVSLYSGRCALPRVPRHALR